MNQHTSLSADLRARGLLKDKTFQDDTWLDTPRTFYLGADCTSADSLTIGNLAVYMLAKRLVNAGWKAVLLVGGATSLIGDPGGKDEERELKPRIEIEHNVAAIKAQVATLFADAEFTLVDNYDWFKDMNYLDFLRDIGKHFSMTELVQRDFIATRMGAESGGISYTEFSYNIIQGYDYWHLHKNNGVELQIGGSDQWGNLLSGVALIRKKDGTEVHALSMPLVINKATGKKFGKSEDGAVWLDAEKTSPTQFYQFWINLDDEGCADYLKIYTELSEQEIGKIVTEHQAAPAKRLAQTRLAEEMTKLVHGQEQLELAQHVTNYLTGEQTLEAATTRELVALRVEIPSLHTSSDGSVIDALVTAGLASSNSEARRLLSGNAISVNGTKLTRETFQASDFIAGKALVRKGKKFRDSALVELAS